MNNEITLRQKVQKWFSGFPAGVSVELSKEELDFIENFTSKMEVKHLSEVPTVDSIQQKMNSYLAQYPAGCSMDFEMTEVDENRFEMRMIIRDAQGNDITKPYK